MLLLSLIMSLDTFVFGTDVIATIFVAMAARDRDGDVIHIETNERRVLDAYVRLANEAEFTSIDFTQASTWTYSGNVGIVLFYEKNYQILTSCVD